MRSGIPGSYGVTARVKLGLVFGRMSPVDIIIKCLCVCLCVISGHSLALVLGVAGPIGLLILVLGIIYLQAR